MPRRLLLCAFLALAMAAGLVTLAHRDAGFAAPVRGAVTLDGEPLAGARVTFQPANGRPSAAVTDDAGRYVLRYSREENGAVPGRHAVTIATREAGKPVRYRTVAELPVRVRVGRNQIRFDVAADGRAVVSRGRQAAAVHAAASAG